MSLEGSSAVWAFHLVLLAMVHSSEGERSMASLLRWICSCFATNGKKGTEIRRKEDLGTALHTMIHIPVPDVC